MFFIKLLVVDKSEFAPLIGNWPWLREKNPCSYISSVSNAWESSSADSLKVKFRLPWTQLEASCKSKTHSLEKSCQLTPPTLTFLMKKIIFVFLFELRYTGMNKFSTIMSKVVEISFAFFCACGLMLIFSGRGAGQLKIYH